MQFILILHLINNEKYYNENIIMKNVYKSKIKDKFIESIVNNKINSKY